MKQNQTQQLIAASQKAIQRAIELMQLAKTKMKMKEASQSQLQPQEKS